MKQTVSRFFKGWLAAALVVSSSVIALAAPRPDDPFYPDVEYKDGTVSVTFTMLETHQHIYDDMFACTLGTPATKPENTGVDGDGRVIYEGFATFTWKTAPGIVFTLDYQGCDEMQCYMPQTVDFSIDADGKVHEGALEGLKSAAAVQTVVAAVTEEPKTTERVISGFVEEADFVAFLTGDGAEAATETDDAVSFTDDPRAWVARHGIWFLIAIVFLGGLALNLTPCVLPMMPINLAIIGAGAVGGSRLQGATRGGAYGLGIALAYGVLALIPVLTGAAFGTIQSAWWFNAAIAAIFVALALALLDVFMIDFTRFSSGGNSSQGTVAAFVAGAVSAILAGACVAPVLIAVLLLTADYYASGSYWALCLPFVLGLGMAAPWPLAGAGLSFLPRPGAWMVWVKKVFAVGVLIFAALYGWKAVKHFLPYDGLDGADLPSIEAAIAAAHAEGKPVLLDFWGTACKACDEMEEKTFPTDGVQKALKPYAFLKVRMDLADQGIRPTQQRFNIKGLPTYIVIEPAK